MTVIRARTAVRVPAELQWQPGPIPPPTEVDEVVVGFYAGCTDSTHAHFGVIPPALITLIAVEMIEHDERTLEWMDQRLCTYDLDGPEPDWAVFPWGSEDQPEFWARLGIACLSDPADAPPTEPELPGENLPN